MQLATLVHVACTEQLVPSQPFWHLQNPRSHVLWPLHTPHEPTLHELPDQPAMHTHVALTHEPRPLHAFSQPL